MRKRTIIGGGNIGLSLVNSSHCLACQIILPRFLFAAGRHPENEMDEIGPPNDGRIAGLNQMEHQGFSSAFIKGIKGSYSTSGRTTR
ncbi:MAG: hypothetical protein ACTHYC_15880 [Sphingobacterium sp.]